MASKLQNNQTVTNLEKQLENKQIEILELEGMIRQYKEELRISQQYFEDECSNHEETKTVLDKVKKLVMVEQYISYEDWQKLKEILTNE